MSFAGINWRNQRNHNMNNIFFPTHYSVANYHTAPLKDMENFGEDVLFNKLHLIPDPLKKNLADQIITDTTKKVSKPDNNMNRPQTDNSTLSGITSFFSGMFNVLSNAVFKRPTSPVNFYDCSDEAPPSPWQNSSKEFKNGSNQSLNDKPASEDVTDMLKSKTVVSNCESKLNNLRQLLTSNSTSKPIKYRSRRPKRVFVEATSIEDCFEDAFSPEDFVSLADESYIEYFSPVSYQDHDLFWTDSPRVKFDYGPIGDDNNTEKLSETSSKATTDSEIKSNLVNSTDCIKISGEYSSDLQTKETVNPRLDSEVQWDSNLDNKIQNQNKEDIKCELVASCEDKLSKLKALLQQRKNTKSCNMAPTENFVQEVLNVEPSLSKDVTKSTKCIPISKTKDKRYKNPTRMRDKRQKSKLKLNINEDLLFANDMPYDECSSVENSPSYHSLETIAENMPQVSVTPKKEYFDEVAGRFRSNSVSESEDSFQIVFNDIPRLRRSSDCESEDSFIVFEDSPDSCYTSNDVFGTESEYTDSDSEIEDSGCNIKLSHSLSRTVSNLADDSLYDITDEVDFARTLPDAEVQDSTLEAEVQRVVGCESTGLLLDDEKKALNRKMPPKKVQFSTQPPKVHVMRVWSFAARQARAGHWERYALDRERFKRRIADADMALSWVLKPQHRSRVMFQRFMPWWNQQRRNELAEKKQKEEEQKLKAEEEERLKIEQEEKLKVEENRLQVNVKEALKLVEEKRLGEEDNSRDGSVVDYENRNGDMNTELTDVNDLNVNSQNVNTGTLSYVKCNPCEPDVKNVNYKDSNDKNVEKLHKNSEKVVKQKNISNSNETSKNLEIICVHDKLLDLKVDLNDTVQNI